MEDAIIQGFAQTIFEIGEGRLTRDKTITNARIEPVVLSFNRVPHHVNEGFHIGILFEVAKELQQEETDRVIGETRWAIGMGHNGADKGEIYQGRDESGKAADDTAVGMDFDIPGLVVVF
jgi:hypothetical protein